MSEVEESSLQLDEKLMRFMDQLELLEEKRATLNSLIEQGWFSMSKARYSMGNKQVSVLQYASEMEPLVKVNARMQDNGEVQFCTEQQTQKSGKEAAKDLRPIEDVGPQEEGVRRRNKSKNEKTEKHPSEDASCKKAPEVNPVRKSEHNPQQDPLKWFGILVPQSLKQAQSSFKQVIELSAEIATLQITVLNTRQELKDGLKNKHAAEERLSSSAGQGGRLNNSIQSKQAENGEELPASESL